MVWYRFRATIHRRWGSYLAIVLLIGLVGGVAMATIAGARRTQSSFPTFLASTNPSDLSLAVFPPGGAAGRYSAGLTRSIEKLSDVKRVESWVQPFGVPLGPRGAPKTNTLSDLTVVGSVDGLSFKVDRPGVVEGRMADPSRTNEFVTTAAGAQLEHWSVGQVVPFGFYTAAQVEHGEFWDGRCGADGQSGCRARRSGRVQQRRRAGRN